MQFSRKQSLGVLGLLLSTAGTGCVAEPFSAIVGSKVPDAFLAKGEATFSATRLLPQVAQTLSRSCNNCHGVGSSYGDFASLKSDGDWAKSKFVVPGAPEKSSLYYRIIGSTGMNPDRSPKNMPSGASQFPAADLELIRSWIVQLAVQSEVACEPQAPAPLVIRRLNKFEFNNTIRDIFGMTADLSKEFPDDGQYKGHSTVGSVLQINDSFISPLNTAVERVANAVVNQTDGATYRLPCEPTSTTDSSWTTCSNTIFGSSATRRGLLEMAFRRPTTSTELGRYSKLVLNGKSNGLTFKQSVGYAIQAVLFSPHFLYLVEDDGALSAGVRKLNPYEVAARLSYFLWSTLPDEELYKAAKTAASSRPAEFPTDVLKAQIARLLKDPRSDRFVKRFSAGWLGLDDFDIANPDPVKFPAFTSTIRSAMRTETETFMRAVVNEQLNINALLSADFTYVNGALASYYDIKNVTGSSFQKVSLKDTERSGLLTQGSVLVQTSLAHRTSPVKRGHFAMERFLCETPPPTPEGLDEMIMDFMNAPIEAGVSIRQKMIAHTTNESCKGCHVVMDNIGFGLESFDPAGRYRKMDNGIPVDSGGYLGSDTFSDATQLSRLLASKESFQSCFVNHVMVYGLGRGIDADSGKADRCRVSSVVTAAGGYGNLTIPTLVEQIVLSPSFLAKSVGGE